MGEHLSSKEVDEINAAYKKAHDEAVDSRNVNKSRANKAGRQAAKAISQAREARIAHTEAVKTSGEFGKEAGELDKRIWQLDGDVTQHTALGKKAAEKRAEAEADRETILEESKEHFENNRDAYRQAAIDENVGRNSRADNSLDQIKQSQRPAA